MKASLLVKSVMLLLSLMSIISWALIFYYFLVLRREKQQLNLVKGKIKGKDLYKYYLILKNHPDEKRGIDALIYAGYQEILYFKRPNNEVLFNAECKMEWAVNQQEVSLRRYVSYLATIGAIAPYVGLLGTVWGIMHAFHLLGNVNQAAINLVAPGIAEALVTTALGLLVAIPATVAFNLVTEKIDKMIDTYQLYVVELKIYFRHEWLNYQLSQRTNET